MKKVGSDGCTLQMVVKYFISVYLHISLLISISPFHGTAAIWAAEPADKHGEQQSEQQNLLPNGDFEQGENTPTGWQTIDGLTSFWVDDPDPKRGKVMKFDTDVLQSQAYQWWGKIIDGASPSDAPKKQATVEPKYDTLAGLDGVWFYSDYIAVEPGKPYWLTVDVKGPGILVWLVGYPDKPDTTFGADQGALQQYLKEAQGRAEPQQRGRPAFIHKYVWKGQMAAGGSNEWKSYSRRAKPFQPTKNTPKVRYVRVLIYPFWPPGTYYVDNVRLVEYQPPGRNKDNQIGLGRRGKAMLQGGLIAPKTAADQQPWMVCTARYCPKSAPTVAAQDRGAFRPRRSFTRPTAWPPSRRST